MSGRPQDGEPGGEASSGADTELCVGPAGSEGQGRDLRGCPVSICTSMAEAWADVGVWAQEARWPQAQLATAGL